MRFVVLVLLVVSCGLAGCYPDALYGRASDRLGYSHRNHPYLASHDVMEGNYDVYVYCRAETTKPYHQRGYNGRCVTFVCRGDKDARRCDG